KDMLKVTVGDAVYPTSEPVPEVMVNVPVGALWSPASHPLVGVGVGVGDGVGVALPWDAPGVAPAMTTVPGVNSVETRTIFAAPGIAAGRYWTRTVRRFTLFAWSAQVTYWYTDMTVAPTVTGSSR